MTDGIWRSFRIPLTRRHSIKLGSLGFAAFLGVWTLLPISGLVPEQFLPPPHAVLSRTYALLFEPFAGFTLPEHLARSLERYLYGVLLAGSIGVPLGLTMAWFSRLDAIVTPVFDALRFIAPIAWVPFAALWFGTGIGGPILIIFSGAFPPCVINAYRGARFVDRHLIEAARMLGAGDIRIIAEVLLPASLPSIVSGLRVGAGLGWQSLIGAELIVASAGIGYLMVQGQAAVSTPTVVSGMLAIGACGFTIDALLRAFEGAVRKRRGAL